MRLLAINRLINRYGHFSPSFNPIACQHFNTLMINNSCNIQHALNGGEFYIKDLGYWVDGYDKQNNVVYEWDERRHFNRDGSLKDKDVFRENEIKSFLNCKFVRIKDPSVLV